MRLKRFIEPRLDAPLPLWMIFPVIFAALYASHFTLLRVPYYWDEAGYYIPAAWDFFRTGSLIPITTLTNAHPPLPSIYLALWWKASGFFPEVTREAVLMVASLGLLAVWRLAMRLVGVAAVAFWTVLLTGLYPIWFAQSSLAHADIFAAACTLWGLVYALPDARPQALGRRAVVFGRRAVEGDGDRDSADAGRGAALWRHFALERARRSGGDCCGRRRGSRVAFCRWPRWYAWHYAKTGFLFGNPEFLRYNAEATLTPLRILAAFGHRILHLTAHMNLFVPVLMAFAALLLEPRPDAEGQRARSASAPALRSGSFLLLLANAVLFSVLGGALLTRYLLPMYPLVLLVAVTTFYRRVPYWHGLAVFSAAAFLVGLFVNPPYGFAPEDNLAYAHVVRLHLAGIAQLERRYPGATVLTAWPVTDELTRPELGYVKQPWDVVRIEDFTAAQIAIARRRSRKSIRRRWCSRPSTIRRRRCSAWARRAKRWTSATSACTTICRRN